MIGMVRQEAIVGVQSFIVQPKLHQACAQGQVRFVTRGIVGDRLAKRSRGLVPSLHAPLAHPGIKVSRGMERLQQRRLRITMRRWSVLLKLILQLAKRKIQCGVPFATVDGLYQFPGSLIQLALQMQRGGLRQQAADARFLGRAGSVFRGAGAVDAFIWMVPAFR